MTTTRPPLNPGDRVYVECIVDGDGKLRPLNPEGEWRMAAYHPNGIRWHPAPEPKVSTPPKASAALDAEFYRVEEGWYWAIYAAGSGLCLADGASQFRVVAAWQLRRNFRRLARTARLGDKSA